MESLNFRKGKNSGITLIALIITIIVLLILAGVSISAITGSENAMEKAKQAKELNKIGEEKETIELARVSLATKNNANTSNIQAQDLQNELDSMIGNGKTTVTGDSKHLHVIFSDTNHFFDLEDDDLQYIGIVDSIPENAVARIETNFYYNLQSAIDSVPNNEKNTIVLLKDISENVTIPENKDITLNLSKYTLKPVGLNRNITVSGKLELENGNIETLYENGTSEGIYINSQGEVKVLNGVVAHGGNCDIFANYGNLEIIGNSTIIGDSRRLVHSNMFT